MPHQTSVPVENKNGELGRDRGDAELRDRFAVEIRIDAIGRPLEKVGANLARVLRELIGLDTTNY